MQRKPLLTSDLFSCSIVAVHGLGGSWDTTWTDENKKLWLRDFLPLDLPRARIMSYGYNAHTAFSKAVTDISDVAASLLDRLDNERPHENKRPIIFISHSLGGIIVKKVPKSLLVLVFFLRR
jgi:pimeloyl-ACP methyl ester carboxylesterase